MSKKSPIFYSAILLTSVNLLLRFVATTFQVYISGKIGAEGIGLLQLVLSVGGLALTAGLAGIRTATMYLTAAQFGLKKPENISHTLSACVGYSIICSCTVAIILSVFAPKIAGSWIGNIHTTGSIRLYAGFLPVSCLCGVMTGYFTAAGRIKTFAAVEVIEQIFCILLTMVLLTTWAENDTIRSCNAIILGSGLGACLTLFLLMILRILERAPEGPPFPIRKKLLNTAAPLAVADDLKAGINTAENLMVPKRLSLYTGAQTPLAAFGTVCGMVFPVLMFPAAIVFSLAELLVPEMSRCNASQNNLRIRYLARKSLRIVFLYGCLLGGLLNICAIPLCQKLYQNQQAGKYLQLYSFLAPMLYCDGIIDAMNKGLGKQKISVQFNILTAILDIVFLYLLLPRFGMKGYYVSFLITHLLNFLMSISLLIKTVKVRIRIKMPVITVFSTCIAILLSSLVPNITLKAICFLLIFFSLMVLTGMITRRDILWIKGLLNNKKSTNVAI